MHQASKYVFILIILMGLSFLSACQTSGDIFEQNFEKEAIKIAEWVEENSTIKKPKIKRPGVVVTSSKEMAYIRSDKTAAFYYHPLNIMFFKITFDANNVGNRGKAIHEYVHYMQLKAWPPIKWKCRAERELEPYRLQLLYYEQQNYKHGYTTEQINSLTTC